MLLGVYLEPSFSNVTWVDMVVAIDLQSHTPIADAQGRPFWSLTRTLGTYDPRPAFSRFKVQLETCDLNDEGSPDCDLDGRHGTEPLDSVRRLPSSRLVPSYL